MIYKRDIVPIQGVVKGPSFMSGIVQKLVGVMVPSDTVTYEKRRVGLHKHGSKQTEAELWQHMDAVDDDGNGTVDYVEFITSPMHGHQLERDEHLYVAFEYFDKDNRG